MQDQQDEVFDLQDEFNFLTGRPTKAEIAQDEADRRAQQLASAKRVSDRSASLSEADYALARFAADEAAIAVKESGRSEATKRAEAKIEALRAKREELTQLATSVGERFEGLIVPGEGLDGETRAKDAVLTRTRQLLVELDLSIADLESAAPLAGVSDAELGEFEVATVKDPLSNAETGQAYYSRATGLIGKLAREFEDAELEYERTLRERIGDTTGLPKHEVQFRTEEAHRTLRVMDADEKRNAARRALEGARGEITRREMHRIQEQQVAVRAREIATDAVTQMDKRERERIEAEADSEAKAVALAKLSIPPSERTGFKDKWSKALAAATDRAREEARERRIQSELHGAVVLPNDPLMRWIGLGERLEVGDLERWTEQDPAAAAALARLEGAEEQRRSRLRHWDEHNFGKGGLFEEVSWTDIAE